MGKQLLDLLNRWHGFYLEADKGAGDGGTGPGTGPGDKNQDNPPPPPTTPPPSGPGTAPGDKGGDGHAIQLSKADLDDRVEKAKRAGQRDLLVAMGFSGVETPDGLTKAQQDLQGLITFAREQQRAQLSAEEQVKADLQAAQQTAADETTKREQLERQLSDAEERLSLFVRRSVIVQAAQGAVIPEDVYTWAVTHQADQVATVFKADVELFLEDGALNPAAIDQDVVKAIVEESRKQRPHYWQGTTRHLPGSPSNHGGQPGVPNNVDDLKKRAVEIARRAL